MNKKSLMTIVILSIFVTGITKGSTQSKFDEQHHREAAAEAIKEYRCREAFDHLEVILKNNPDDEKAKEAHQRLTILAEKQEQKKQAQESAKNVPAKKEDKEESPGRYRAFNTPVNYNYAQISVGRLVTDGRDYFVLSGGGEGMINENWFFDLFFRGYIFDEEVVTGAENFINLGVNYRHPVDEKVDIVVGAGATYGWYKYDTYFSTVTGNDLGLLLDSSLRFGFTEEFEGSIEFSFLNIYDSTLTTVLGSLSYYPVTNFGFGVSAGKLFGDGTDGTTINTYIRLNFD